MKKVFLFCVLLSFFCSTSFSQTFPTGFSTTDIGSGWVNPIGTTFTPNGQNLFVWEKRGHVYVCIRNGSGVYVKQTTPVIDIEEEVGNWRDMGLAGFALDPNFASNGYIYLYYVVDRHHLLNFGTASYNPSTNDYVSATIGRITRYQTSTVAGNIVANIASRTILLGETKETGIPILHDSHGACTIQFAADGTLIVSTGDGASYTSTDAGSASESYYLQALNDGIIRSQENIGSFRSQMLNSHNGKLLRINPNNGDGISNNPFYDPSSPRSPKSRVWALGFRNPFRFTIKPGTGSTNPSDGDIGEIYVGDVGWDTWEELHIIKYAGTNAGWPLFEGHTDMFLYSNLNIQNLDEPNPLFNGTSCNTPFFKFKDLLKQATADNIKTVFNPCNNSVEIGTGNRYFHSRPSLDWHHFDSNARVGFFTGNNPSVATIGTPLSGVEGSPFKGNASVGGSWYTGTTYPEKYRNTYFHADYGGGWLRSIDLDLNISHIHEVHGFGSGFAAIVSVNQNPIDSNLVYVDYWINRVRIIKYGGNQLPVVVMSSDKKFGPSILNVTFNSNSSFDPDGTIVSRSWDFGDGSPTSSSINPSHSFTALPATPTKYVVKLTITDNSGGSSVDSIIISVNNTPPVVNITSPIKNSFYTPGPDTIYTCTATVSDAEHTPGELKYAWRTILRHNTHQHPEPIDTNKITTTSISRINCTGENYFWEFRLTVTDAAGLSTTDTSFIYPKVIPSVSITSNPGNPVCIGTLITFTATPIDGGSSPSYQWKLNGSNVGTNSNQYQNSSLINGDIVTCVMSSSLPCAIPANATSNAITMQMPATIPPFVSIAANPGSTICLGSPVTFTATPTNGGPTPSYQWKLNGSNVGTNSNQYQNTNLATGNIVTCVMTSSLTCASPTTATSNAITFTVLNSIIPSVTISTNTGNTICATTLVTFTAIPINGGPNPTYQWKVNGDNVGGNGNLYQSSSLLNNDNVTCVMTSNAACPSPASVSSNTIIITVNALVTPSLSISANTGNTICAGMQVTFNATPINGGANPSYQWKLNGTNVGINSNQYQNSSLMNGAIVTCELTSNANCANPTSAVSNNITITVNPNVTPSVNIAANPGNSICSGTQVTFAATPINGGSTPSFQWKLNGNNVGSNSNQYQNSSLINGDIVTCVVTSSLVCASPTTATSNAITLNVNASVIPSVTIVADPVNTICNGTLVTFTASPTNGGSTPTFQWKLNGNNTGINSTQYQNSSLLNGDVVTCQITSNAGCASPATVISNVITMSVTTSVIPTVSIVANPGSTICSGTQVTFTATPAKGGSTPFYQWKLNGVNVGTNSIQYQNSSLINNDVVTCVMTSSLTCANPATATSNPIMMVVSVLVTPSVTIAASSGNTICSGTQVTFTASPTNGGSTPSYQWKLNGNNVGINSNQYQNSGLLNGDIVTCVLTSNANCSNSTTAVSNAITMTVNPLVTPTVSIAANPGNTICSGTQVTFVANPINGGSNPSFQWKLNGNNVGTNSNQYQNISLANADIVTCVLTSAANCASPVSANSNAITMAVTTSVTPSVSIAANPGNTICTGSQVTFTATPTNGGTNPTYQWKLNGNNVGINSNQYQSTSLVNGDVMTCVMTSNLVCLTTASAISNALAMTVNVSPSISAHPLSQIINEGSGVNFTVVATGNGLTFQWRKGGINIPSATNNSYSIANVVAADAGNYNVIVSGFCLPAVTSNVATLTVNTITTQPSNQSVCSGANAIFNVAASGSLLTYQWQISISGSSFVNIAGATSSTLNLNAVTIGLNGNKYRCVINGNLISNTGNLTVISSPVVSLVLPFDTLYQNSPNQVLTGGNPAGGLYSGVGISAGSFNPAANPQGNYSATYQYSNVSGCTSNATDVFTIIAQVIEVNLYPNPAENGILTIVTSPFLVGSNVTAYNSFGQKISEWNIAGRRTTYSFKWPAGNYILYFKKENTIFSKKLIILR